MGVDTGGRETSKCSYISCNIEFIEMEENNKTASEKNWFLKKSNSVMEIIQFGEKQLSQFLQLEVASHDSIFAHLTAAPPSASRPGQGILWVTWQIVIHL